MGRQGCEINSAEVNAKESGVSTVVSSEGEADVPADTRTGSWGLPEWRCHVVESEGGGKTFMSVWI